MFTLPQGSLPTSSRSRDIKPRDTASSTITSTEIVNLDEDSRTLEPLLRMICGLEIPVLEHVGPRRAGPLRSAEVRHAGPGLDRARAPAHARVRRRATAAVRCSHFGWAEDARMASTRSLSVNLYNPKNRPAPLRLRTADLLALFELHHERRKHFRQRIAEPPFLTDPQLGDTARCSRCRDSISYVEWRELRNAMFAELEICPVGDTVLAGLEVWPAALTCWSAKCKRATYLSPVYDKTLSSKAIKDVLDALPNAVELPMYVTA